MEEHRKTKSAHPLRDPITLDIIISLSKHYSKHLLHAQHRAGCLDSDSKDIGLSPPKKGEAA